MKRNHFSTKIGWGPFKYYVIIGLGGWVQVGGSEKVQKPAYVIFEWSLTLIYTPNR